MNDQDAILAAMKVSEKGGIRLSKIDAASTAGVDDKKKARELLAAAGAELDALQYKLYAEAKTALLVVFQAIDTGGKDGVIRNVFGPLNPQGVQASSFKRPTSVELGHDFLWRIHRQTPSKGEIRIFNRSHYEDVLIRRVHKMDPKKVIEARYRQINDFERLLADNGTRIVKFFLHISKEEQKRRLEARLDNPDKRWKFEMADIDERKSWNDYQEAFEAMLSKCSASHAPWYVIPSDHKWYRDWAVSRIVLRTLKKINPKFPRAQEGLDAITIK